VPGATLLPDGRKLVATVVSRAETETRQRIYVDSAAVGDFLSVRNWRPGDRFVPLGMTGRKRVKQLFSDLKVEKEERLRTPLVIAGVTLLWVAGLQRSSFGVVTPFSAKVVRIELV
ncbi:MAG TPA: tRNA lysidine(34) synthetase TilS, partial [Pelovirga sp.]|nr:tRNA lysidine(34) synthetase TilS [Pelovirga sp.]